MRCYWLCTDCVCCVCVWYVGSGPSCFCCCCCCCCCCGWWWWWWRRSWPLPSRVAPISPPLPPLNRAPYYFTRQFRLAPARSNGNILAQLGVFAHAGEAGPFEVVLDEGVLLIEHRIALRSTRRKKKKGRRARGGGEGGVRSVFVPRITHALFTRAPPPWAGSHTYTLHTNTHTHTHNSRHNQPPSSTQTRTRLPFDLPRRKRHRERWHRHARTRPWSPRNRRFRRGDCASFPRRTCTPHRLRRAGGGAGGNGEDGG
jgi:hypothetical protein